MPVPTCHGQFPPFADNITAAPLISISLAKLEASDAVESTAFFEACQKLGFFYMNMENSALGERIVSGAEQLLQVQKEFFKRPNEEKETYAREKIDAFFGYRHVDLKKKNSDGTTQRAETYNVKPPFCALRINES